MLVGAGTCALYSPAEQLAGPNGAGAESSRARVHTHVQHIDVHAASVHAWVEHTIQGEVQLVDAVQPARRGLGCAAGVLPQAGGGVGVSAAGVLPQPHPRR